MCESEMSHLIFASLLHPLCNFESTQSDRSDQQLQLFSSDDSCLSECHLHNNHLSVICGLELNIVFPLLSFVSFHFISLLGRPLERESLHNM